MRDRRAAIRSAYRHCAPPTLQAALISGLSLSVFVLSTFTPTQRMGWLMMSILLAGVVAELIMLPALLAGPLGKAFPIQPQNAQAGRRTICRRTTTTHCAPRAKSRHASARAKSRLACWSTVAKPELSAGRHQPHAFTLRDRLAGLRRSARDGGKP